MEHDFLGTFQGQAAGASWTFNWVAPSTDVGPVTFYAAGNQANNNGNETGDQIYTTSASVRVASVITGAPIITGASVIKNNCWLWVTNFDFEAQLLMDGAKQKKTFNDETDSAYFARGQEVRQANRTGPTVVLQVKNRTAHRPTSLALRDHSNVVPKLPVAKRKCGHSSVCIFARFRKGRGRCAQLSLQRSFVFPSV
jgi:hypothetical protein